MQEETMWATQPDTHSLYLVIIYSKGLSSQFFPGECLLVSRHCEYKRIKALT